jgi:signal transduction histidine kinase
MLDEFYRNIVSSGLRQNADNITANIDKTELGSFIETLSYKEDTSFVLIDSSGTVLYKYCREPSFLGSFSDSEYLELYKTAKNSGGEHLDTFQSDDLSLDDIADASSGISIAESFVYVRIIKNSSGAELGLLSECDAAPLNASQRVSILMSLVISAGVIILTILITIVLNRKVAKPIAALTASAMTLADGTSDVVFKEKGFKELNELSEALNYASKEISAVEHLRRELIANVSHDLRTPLTLIKGYTEVMRDIPEENTPENLQIVIDETDRLTNLVNDMLDISKMQSGDVKLHRTYFDIVKLLSEIVNRHSTLLSRNGYKIDLICDDSLWVFADEIKVSQVIYNLLSNAVNYAGDDMQILVRAYVKEKNVRVEVIDHGIGIDVDKIPHIWDRYYKSDRSHKRSVVGTGIGLSIVKNVMLLHPGGVYGVDSSKGSGSKFYIELPRIEIPSDD